MLHQQRGEGQSFSNVVLRSHKPARTKKRLLIERVGLIELKLQAEKFPTEVGAFPTSHSPSYGFMVVFWKNKKYSHRIT